MDRESPLAAREARRARRRAAVRRARRTVLFAGLLAAAVWGILAYRADHHTFAWSRPVTVAFVAVLDPSGGPDTGAVRFAERFLSRAGPPRDNLLAVEKWMETEFARRSGSAGPAFEFSVRGPLALDAPPPSLPARDAPFWSRLWRTRRFIGYFEDLARRDELLLASYDVTIFLYFYDAGDERRRHVLSEFDSIAVRRSRMGVVFAPVNRSLLGNTCAMIAHELCHTLGASDKYGASGTIHPQGFVEPDQKPLFPQRFAEIMALGRPLAPGEDELVTRLEDCRAGEVTAREMGWTQDR